WPLPERLLLHLFGSRRYPLHSHSAVPYRYCRILQLYTDMSTSRHLDALTSMLFCEYYNIHPCSCPPLSNTHTIQIDPTPIGSVRVHDSGRLAKRGDWGGCWHG